MYTQGSLSGTLVPVGTGVLGVETVSAAVAVHGEFLVLKRCKVKKFFFAITTTIAANSTAPQVVLKRRLAQGVTSGQSTVATLIIPDLTAAGKVMYKTFTPFVLNPGDTICLEHTVQAADGTAAAGAGYYGFELEDYPEEPGNEGDMVKTA